MKHYFTLVEAAEAAADEVVVSGDVAVAEASADAPASVETSTEVPSRPEAGTATTTDGQQEGGSPWTMWIMLGLIFVVMWFFMIRPQKKQQKELQKFRDSLKKGDKVVTIGGIYGTIVEVKEASVLIEVDNAVKIRVSKQALIKDFSESQQ